MFRHRLDDRTLDRLLSGSLDPDDAPPAYASVAALVRTARGPATPDELAGEARVVATVAQTVATGSGVDEITDRRRPMLAKLVSAKAAMAAAIVLAGGTAAAAGTGSLPSPAQNVVSSALSHVGVSVPDGHGAHRAKGSPADHRGNADQAPGQRGRSGGDHGQATEASGPNANADYGLCTALLATVDRGGANDHSQKFQSSAFQQLISAHGGTAESAATYCRGVVSAKQAERGQGRKQGTETTVPGETTETTVTTVPGETTTTAASTGHAPVTTAGGDRGNPANPGHATTTSQGTPGRSGGAGNPHAGRSAG